MEFYLKELRHCVPAFAHFESARCSLREVSNAPLVARKRVDADLLAAPPVPDAIRSARVQLGHNPGESLSNAMTDKPRLIESRVSAGASLAGERA